MQAKGKVCKQKLRRLSKAFPSFLSPTRGIYSMSKKVCPDDSSSCFLLSLCKIKQARASLCIWSTHADQILELLSSFFVVSNSYDQIIALLLIRQRNNCLVHTAFRKII